MTVISMLSFGESGAAIADEQSSTALRKYNVSMKLQTLNNDRIIYGGSGPSDFIKEVYDQVNEYIGSRDSSRGLDISNIHSLVKNSITSIKRQKNDTYMLDNFGISFEMFQCGTLGGEKSLDPSYKSQIYDQLRLDTSFRDSVSLCVLLGGIEDGKFEICYADSGGGSQTRISRPYASIGSGSDQSGLVLSRYVASLSRKERDDIDAREGLVKLIESLNAAIELNPGVGGSPSIIYQGKDGIIEPGEDEGMLSSELVKGLGLGQLEKDFVYDSVNRLLLENADVGEVEEEMKQKAKDWNSFDRYLRGYK